MEIFRGSIPGDLVRYWDFGPVFQSMYSFDILNPVLATKLMIVDFVRRREAQNLDLRIVQSPDNLNVYEVFGPQAEFRFVAAMAQDLFDSIPDFDPQKRYLPEELIPELATGYGAIRAENTNRG